MERVITLPSLRSLGFQLKCLELVLLPKAAAPDLQNSPKHTSHRHRPAADKAGLPGAAQTPVSATGENKRRWEVAGRGEAFLLVVVLNENT